MTHEWPLALSEVEKRVAQFETNPAPLGRQEYQQIKARLLAQFSGRGAQSSDLLLNRAARQWMAASVEYCRKLETVAAIIAGEINQSDPGTQLDINLIEARAGILGLGRIFSNNPDFRGPIGCNLLKELGFAEVFQKTALMQMENSGGLGRQAVAIDWDLVATDQDKFDELEQRFSLADLILVLANWSVSAYQPTKEAGIMESEFKDPLETMIALRKVRRPFVFIFPEVVRLISGITGYVEGRYGLRFQKKSGIIQKAGQTFPK